MSFLESFERLYTLVASAVCGCAFVATYIVLTGRAPQVFNQTLRLNHLLNVGLIMALPVAILLLLSSFFWRPALRLRRPLLLLFTVILSLDLLVLVFDKTVISVKGSPLHIASYSVDIGDGTFFLDQANDKSPFGFRTPRVEPKATPVPRILMLGNSYVAGSGTTFATNYPQLLEKDLNAMDPAHPVSVFSAGVNAYGILEDRYLYDYLREQGYHFDTVVANFYLGGDQTNDIRDTTRIAMAGRAQRIHTNWLLRYFYPLNSPLFRFLVYLHVTFDNPWQADVGSYMAQNLDGSCRKNAGFDAFSREHAVYNYGPGAKERIELAYSQQGIESLARDAAQHGSRFALVLLPDLNALLQINRDRFQGQPMDYNWVRQYLTEKADGKYPVLDLSGSFEEHPELFRCNDTHWNDKGNLRGAKVVADFLHHQSPVKAQ